MATPNNTSETIEIPLTRGFVTIVDRQDYEWLLQWRWRATTPRDLTYVNCTLLLNKKPITVAMHRLIMEEIVGKSLTRYEVVDHINGNTLDNRRANLRLSSPAENGRNRAKSKTNTSGFKGVSDRYKDGSWIAIITYNRKNIYLGRFDTKIEAARAYDRAAIWYHREFAQLNFPDYNYGEPEEPNRTRQKGRTLNINRT